MYYGKGAGNRLKLIKAKVNSIKKVNPHKHEFDKLVSEPTWLSVLVKLYLSGIHRCEAAGPDISQVAEPRYVVLK